MKPGLRNAADVTRDPGLLLFLDLELKTRTKKNKKIYIRNQQQARNAFEELTSGLPASVFGVF